MMNLKTYQQAALKTAVFPPETAVKYLTMGLMGEVGELMNVRKKQIRKPVSAETRLAEQMQQDARRRRLADELGDCCWYAVVLAYEIGMELHDTWMCRLDQLPDLDDALFDLFTSVGQLSAWETEVWPRELKLVICKLSLVSQCLGVEIEVVMRENIEKLQERAAEGTLAAEGPR